MKRSSAVGENITIDNNDNPVNEQDLTKPRRRLRSTNSRPWYHYAALSVNPYFVYPLIFLSLLTLQLIISQITTETFTFGLFGSVSSIITLNDIEDYH